MHGIKFFVGSVSIIIMMMYIRFKVVCTYIPKLEYNFVRSDDWILNLLLSVLLSGFFFRSEKNRKESTMGNEQCYVIFMESSSLYSSSLQKGRPLSAHESEIENRRRTLCTHTFPFSLHIIIFTPKWFCTFFQKKKKLRTFSLLALHSPHMLALICKQIENGRIFSIFHVHHTQWVTQLYITMIHFFRNFQTFAVKKSHNFKWKNERRNAGTTKQQASWRFLNFSRRAIFPSKRPLSLTLPRRRVGCDGWGWVKLKHIRWAKILWFML